jgi:type VI secretion system protein ImpG
MIDKYYEDELRYLYESGREFAKAHPDRAHFLNIDAVGDRDPYVERLFEGFAFLSGRIREKLDDSFPELTEGLINLMWPHFLREIPSMAIVQFNPRAGALQETRILPRGSELLSNQVGAERAICKFSTTADVRLNPITLEKIDKSVNSKGNAQLTFRFLIGPGVQWKNLKLAPLRLYLHAEMPTAFMLYDFLIGRVISCRIECGNNQFSCDVDPAGAVSSCGFSPEESIVPFTSRTFQGYSLLLEYFSFPEKFLFVDLHGFDKVPFLEPSPQRFSFSLTFDGDFSPDKPFSKDAFRLLCAPAANIFKKEVEPIVNNGMEEEYRVVADAAYPASFHIHSIVSVTGIDRATGSRNSYQPLYSFSAAGKKHPRSYSWQYRRMPDNRREVYISFGGEMLTGPAAASTELREENCTVQALCTNGILPREEIREGGIKNPGVDFPDFVMLSNITRPTPPLSPPHDEEYLWVFLSHLSSTFTTLSNPATLKALLRLYNWSDSEGRARKIDAISDVSSVPIERIINGSTIRGIEFSVAVAESNFIDRGDLRLFGEVLNEFLAHYISINTFLELALIMKPSLAALRWDSLKGKQWPI